MPPGSSPTGTLPLAGFRPVLEIRSSALAAIRRFFHHHHYLEVETPVRVKTPAPELHIDAEPAGGKYLRTSPELHMKRLLAAGYPRIFQMGPCFRRGEQGALHHPEYTMLEWYQAGADYLDILQMTRELLNAVAREVTGNPKLAAGKRVLDLDAEWPVFTVREAFLTWAGWDPVAAFEADRFDLDLVEKVEPNLPRDVPVILMDYPAPLAALARLKKTDPGVAERWELYLAGIEIANAYSELNHPGEQRQRFETWGEARSRAGRASYPEDEAFMEALEAGMPDAGGIALGVDRLVMLLAGKSDLDAVLPFREG